MATQGAMNIIVTIRGQSVTIERKNLVSLQIKRVMGDAANEFTLEVFDETAWKVENALFRHSQDDEQYAPISVMYAASNDVNTKTIIFNGMCTDYQTAFSGRSVMITIQGILADAGDASLKYIFNKQSIEWVGGANEDLTEVDGKPMSGIQNDLNNEDICAIIGSDKTVYYNPTRIFKRIIHKYNGDKLGSNYASTSSSGGTSVLGGNTEEIVWNFFTSNGFSNQATAGIMGNIYQESGFNPANIQNHGAGPAAGLFQWESIHNPQSRFGTMQAFCGGGDKWKTDITGQCRYALSELQSALKTYSKKNYGRLVSLFEFQRFTDIREATICFEKCFERAGKPNMENRISAANQYYNKYTNGNVAISTSTSEVNGTGGAVDGWGTGGTGNFPLDEANIDESMWIAGLSTLQQNQTASQYIQQVLAKNAIKCPDGMTAADVARSIISGEEVKLTNELAGFKYSITSKGHSFKAVDYVSKATSSIHITYGEKNSNVISFAVSNMGSAAMSYWPNSKSKKVMVTSSAFDEITGDSITLSNIGGYKVTEEDQDYVNWYLDNGSIAGVNVSSTASTSGLKSQLTNTWSELESWVMKAELSLWRRKE